MLKLFEKYITFDNANKHVAKKIEGVKTLEEAFEVFEKASWHLSASLVSAIKEDYEEYKKIAEKDKKDYEEQLAKEEAVRIAKEKEAEEKAAMLKAEAEKEAEKSKAGKASKSLDPDAAKRYEGK